MHRRGFLAALAAALTAGCGSRGSASGGGATPAREPYDVPDDWSAGSAYTPTPEPTPTAEPRYLGEGTYDYGEWHEQGALAVTVDGVEFRESFYPLYADEARHPPDGTAFAVGTVRIENPADVPMRVSVRRWAIRADEQLYVQSDYLPSRESDTRIHTTQTLKGYGRTPFYVGLELGPGEREEAWFAAVVPAGLAASDLAAAYADDTPGEFDVAWTA